MKEYFANYFLRMSDVADVDLATEPAFHRAHGKRPIERKTW